MKRGVLPIVALIFILLLSFPALSLSLSGPKLSPIDYLPGKSITNHYTIIDSEQPVAVKLDKGIFSNISITEVIGGEFDLLINFPEREYIPPGSHTFSLSVVEDTPEQAGISSQVAVSKVFEVIVYSYEKEIRTSLSVPNINEGSNATAFVSVQSLGYPDIEEVYAEVSLYDGKGIEVGTRPSERKPLPGLAGEKFAIPFDTDSFPAGEYAAYAKIRYDGLLKTSNTTFLIGNMDLLLLNYTSVLTAGFSEFSVQVKNNWGNPLRNVYAKLYLNGTEVVQTPSIDLEPWQEGTLSSIAKIELPAGDYVGPLQLFFEGERKEISLPFTIRSEIEDVQREVRQTRTLGLFPGMIAIAILLFLLGLYLWKHHRSAEI